MNATIRTLLLSLLLAISMFGQERHIEKPLKPRKAPSGTAVMNERIRSAAKTYRAFAPLSRFALFGIALPSDSSELVALNANAVILISSICQDKAELPLKAVYVKGKHTQFKLKECAQVLSLIRPSDTLVIATLGNHRCDSFYLLPLEADEDSSEVFIDFTVNRVNFRIGTLTGAMPILIKSRLQPRDESKDQPHGSPVMKLIAREFPGILRVKKK